MAKNASRYNLFQADRRGNDNVERALERMINEMQTADNLKKLAAALTIDPWRTTRSAPTRKLDYSSFLERLNRAKIEEGNQTPDRAGEDNI
jgi:lipopolysaccharide assembly outer membrane protein LptD (OstA)